MSHTVVEDDLFVWVQDRVRARWGKEASTSTGACILFAQATVEELKFQGHKAMLQAGSALWRICPDDKDDGERPLNFGYVFDPREAAMRLMARNCPEIHAWAVKIEDDKPTLIDCTFGFQPAQCKKMINIDWEPEMLPTQQTLYLDGPHPNYSYEARRDAMSIVHKLCF